MLLHCSFLCSLVVPALCGTYGLRLQAATGGWNNSCCLYGNKCQASFRQQHQQRKLIFLNASMVACGDGRWQPSPPHPTPLSVGCLWWPHDEVSNYALYFLLQLSTARRRGRRQQLINCRRVTHKSAQA